MTQAISAGKEIESVDPIKMLWMKIVIEQKTAFGDVFEWLYLGKNIMIRLKKVATVKNKKKKIRVPFDYLKENSMYPKFLHRK